MRAVPGLLFKLLLNRVLNIPGDTNDYLTSKLVSMCEIVGVAADFYDINLTPATSIL